MRSSPPASWASTRQDKRARPHRQSLVDKPVDYREFEASESPSPLKLENDKDGESPWTSPDNPEAQESWPHRSSAIPCSKPADSLIKINPNQINSSTFISMDGRVYRLVLDFFQPDAMVVCRDPRNMHFQLHDDQGDAVINVDGEQENDSFLLSAEPGSLVHALQADPDIWLQASRPKKGNYICNHCKKRFKRIYRLAKHLDDLEIKRPHRCNKPKCVWSVIGFSKRSELNRHVKSQHGRASYRCPVQTCMKYFNRKDAVARHVAALHPGTN